MPYLQADISESLAQTTHVLPSCRQITPHESVVNRKKDTCALQVPFKTRTTGNTSLSYTAIQLPIKIVRGPSGGCRGDLISTPYSGYY